jgi:hypothetical protein
MKYWEIIADNLKKRGWSLGWVSAIDCEGRTIWIADAHRDAKRFVVRADEKLTAFLELEAEIHAVEASVQQLDRRIDLGNSSLCGGCSRSGFFFLPVVLIA